MRNILNGLSSRLRAAADLLFAPDDARALRHGWQIETTRGGLGRSYRDPRFDNLARCPVCRADGTTEFGEPCGRCAATGRITLGQRSGTGAVKAGRNKSVTR